MKHLEDIVSVESKPLRAKQSAIVSRATLDKQRGTFERFTALGILFFSFAGTVAAFSGGWSALASQPRLAPIAGGIAAQVGLTAAQWWYGSGRGPWRYRASLALDSALTTIGYAPLIVPWLAPYLAGRGAGEVAAPLAWLVIGVLSFLVAWYPERTLID
jgi:hypothetical protein